MSPPSDVEMLAEYKRVLEEARRFGGYIQWRPLAANRLREDFEGWTQRAVEGLMHEHSDSVHQTIETRDNYRDLYSHHYDFRIPIGDCRAYIETVLDYCANDSTIVIVNLKPANAIY